MVQKYQNEIPPIFYYGISTKTSEKDLKIPFYRVLQFAVSNLSHFLGFIFDFSPLKEEANPMVVTSVVTYTFPIGPFLGAPSSRYGPSVDWGGMYLSANQ